MNFLLSLWYRYKHWRWERRCIKHLGIKPTKMYVSQEAYDALIEALNAPPDPERTAKIRRVLERKAPWEDDYDN